MKQSTLLDALKSLLGSGVITQSEYVSMQRMVERDDDLMDAAYEAYEMDEDAEDLLTHLHASAKYTTRRDHDNVDDDIGELSEAQKTIVSVIDLMLDEGSVDDSGAALLRQLAALNNEFLLAAFEVYSSTGDLADFKDTMQRVLSISVSSMSTTDEAVSSDGAYPSEDIRSMIDAFNFAESTQAVLHLLCEKQHPYLHAAHEIFATGKNRNRLLSAVERLATYYGVDRVLDRLVSAGLITSDQATSVSSRFLQRDPVVLAAWDVFIQSRDINDFADTLLRIARGCQSPMIQFR